ncbi:MAG: dethiobiotin synthase [Gammaproteobacteria bacterium]|nr:dethiobiotin synthase [Gammaproteobacteria bacterium]
MQFNYFITGTDTNIGKTWATVALMNYFKSQGKTVAGMKPVASGCELIDGKLVNADALLLQEHASINLAYEAVNPYAYRLPISLHLAGRDNPANFPYLQKQYNQLKNQVDIVLVEGAGGWYSPVTVRQSNGDLANALGLPVLLIVGVRLGCINHALLTAKAIAADGATCAGWIANCLQPNEGFDVEVINLLKEQISAPCLGVLPYLPEQDFSQMLKSIDFIDVKG